MLTGDLQGSPEQIKYHEVSFGRKVEYMNKYNVSTTLQSICRSIRLVYATSSRT
jgi:hypothetical protein